MDLKLTIIRLFFISFPAILAAVLHMVIVKLDVFPVLKYPLDFGKTFRGKRIFGANKTFRGLIAMVAFSIGFCYLYVFLVQKYPGIRIYNTLRISEYAPWVLGLAYGLGYILFELPNSFMKRQLDIAPGKNGGFFHIILDQVDSVIGCFVFLSPFATFNIWFVIEGLVLFSVVHIVINLILYATGIRKNPL